VGVAATAVHGEGSRLLQREGLLEMLHRCA